MDSVEISLLTCQPHDEIYSLYGHTAIRYHDLRKGGLDIAFNYGVFDYHKPLFALRFVFGLTDYELGAYPFRLFLEEYRRFGSMVTEQVLNLTAEEKMTLQQALAVNMQNENRIYRYNYFYSNCTTKARDIIEQSIQGKVSYEKRESYSPSHREMIHEMTQNNPWSAFGNDLLLGILADQPTDQRQQEFLPYHLMYDFDHASIYQDGKFRPLVKERRQPLPAGVQLVKSGFPLSPLACGIILVALALGLFFLQVRNKCIYRWWDALLMVTVGTFGIILFLMLFSQHPTVSLNLQILLLNPLPWFFLWKVVRRRPTRYWSITAILCVLFLIGGLFQHYAEGIWSLALCLLLQCYLHLKHRWA
ncbi:MAG: DUF4105 domain-containing protein [Prevotella sp.]|nr:DUF4105 domain-containing protein [Prevotella sp.]